MIILKSLRLRRAKKQEETENSPVPKIAETPPSPAWQENLFTAPQQKFDEEISGNETSAILSILEKICAMLEQIAGNTEACLRKMESADDDGSDLKFS